MGKVRLRQLRVKKNGCKLADAVVQTGTKKDGSPRQRQLIDYCFPPYYPEVRDEEAFGPPELQQPGGGFIYSTAEDNLLATATVEGQVGTYDGSGLAAGFKCPLACLRIEPRLASLDHLKAAPTQAGAPFEQLGGSLWPQELASGCRRDGLLPTFNQASCSTSTRRTARRTSRRSHS